MSLTLNVKDFRALSLQAAVFSLSGEEVHVSVVPYAQNEGIHICYLPAGRSVW